MFDITRIEVVVRNIQKIYSRKRISLDENKTRSRRFLLFAPSIAEDYKKINCFAKKISIKIQGAIFVKMMNDICHKRKILDLKIVQSYEK